MVQWLGLHTPNAGAQVQSLVGELDPACWNAEPACGLEDVAQTKKKKRERENYQAGLPGAHHIYLRAFVPLCLPSLPPFVSSGSADSDLQGPPGRFSRALRPSQKLLPPSLGLGPQGGLTGAWSEPTLNLEGVLNSNQPWRRLSCALWCLWGPEQLLSTPQDADPFPPWLGNYRGFSIDNPHIWEDHTQDGTGHTSRSQVQFRACSDQTSVNPSSEALLP